MESFTSGQGKIKGRAEQIDRVFEDPLDLIVDAFNQITDLVITRDDLDLKFLEDLKDKISLKPLQHLEYYTGYTAEELDEMYLDIVESYNILIDSLNKPNLTLDIFKSTIRKAQHLIREIQG